jgi:hypothetical protein
VQIPILYRTGDNELRTKTLAHKITDGAELKALICHGFTKFNHLDGEEDHALISLSRKDHIPDPSIMELLLDGGSHVDHKKQDGHTALHMIAQHLRAWFYVSKSDSRDKEWHCNGRNQVLDCIRLLIDRKSDPFLEDKCRCACSDQAALPLI